MEAQQLGLRSTPSLLVNGELVDGGAQYEILSAKIRQALAESN
jgi:protein-disulfide isomerase